MPTWHEALREWNRGKDAWCMPRKGTVENDAVRAIMARGLRAPKAPKAPKAPAVKAPAVKAPVVKAPAVKATVVKAPKPTQIKIEKNVPIKSKSDEKISKQNINRNLNMMKNRGLVDSNGKISEEQRLKFKEYYSRNGMPDGQMSLPTKEWFIDAYMNIFGVTSGVATKKYNDTLDYRTKNPNWDL